MVDIMVDASASRDAQRDQLSVDVEQYLSKGHKIEPVPIGRQAKEDQISKRWIIEGWPKWRDYR